MKQLFNNHLFIFLVIPFILGIITSLSLPPYNFVFINFITFPTLIFVISKAKILNKEKKFFFLIGWIFGFGYFLFSLYWIVYSLTFDEMFKIFIPFALILIPSFLSIFYGLAIFCLINFDFNKKLTLIFIFSLIFSILEFLRGNILSGFPWNLIVYSWSSIIESIQILSYIGTYSLNLVSITIFSLPFVIFCEKKITNKILIIFVLLFVLLANYFYGFKILSEKNSHNFKKNNYLIKVISSTISIDQFLQDNNEEKILKELIKLSNPDPNVPTLFIWPEGVLSSIYLEELKKYKNLFFNNFSSNHLIALGVNSYQTVENSYYIFNSLALVNNKLDIISVYHKNKLVPFGEFLPFENFFGKFGLKKITYGYESFTKGFERNEIKFKNDTFNINFLPLICYEIIYSGKLKRNNQKFDFIINISEDGWFGKSIGPEQHFAHTIFRAIEERKYIFRSTNNGISGIVDSNGRIVNGLKTTKKGVVQVMHFGDNVIKPFSKFGNKIFFCFLIFYITLIFFTNRLEKK